MKLPFNSVISGLALMVILGFAQCAGRHHGTSREESTVEVGQQSYQKLEPLRVNFYLERSGSMTPYDSPRGDGSFKAAFVSMLNSVPGDANRLYIVNDSIYRYPKGIRQFISDDNIFASSKGIGDPSYTDFQRIFQAILENTEKNEISVLFTDMIYSVKTMEGTNPRKIFSDATGMISSVFNSAWETCRCWSFRCRVLMMGLITLTILPFPDSNIPVSDLIILLLPEIGRL